MIESGDVFVFDPTGRITSKARAEAREGTFNYSITVKKVIKFLEKETEGAPPEFFIPLSHFLFTEVNSFFRRHGFKVKSA